MGKKVIARHTLLPCTGGAIPLAGLRSEVKMDVGSVVWARAYLLPAWPGQIISPVERGLQEPTRDKVLCDYIYSALKSGHPV